MFKINITIKMEKTLTELYNEVKSLPNIILETDDFKLMKPTHEIADSMYNDLIEKKEKGEKFPPFLFWNTHRLFRAIISELKK